MTYQLDVLVPSRGRPASIARLWQAIQDTAAHPERIRLLVRLDDDDPTADRYPLQNVDQVWYSRGPRIRLARSWNALARVAATADATHLALWGDDNIPITQGWDRAFVDRLEQDGPGWVYGRDGIWDGQPHPEHPEHLVLPTATVMSVGLYQALGWVAPPGLVHLCIDVAWRDLGLDAGCLFYEPGVMIRHFHRVAGAPNDATYSDANDNPEQFRADNIGIQRWAMSRDYQQDLATVREYRAVCAALRADRPAEHA
jgi:hypothetical protein